MYGHGKRADKNGVEVPRGWCIPADPSIKPHAFTIRVKAPPGSPAAARLDPPPCPRHPDTSVRRRRYGKYRKAGVMPRQMYQCQYVDLDTGELIWHKYTPPLPRDHVHPDNHNDHCDECEELRGVHNGETSVARRHGWSTRIVARGLDKLAHGASYAAVSIWAVEATGQRRTRARPGDDGTKTDAQLDYEIAMRAKERRKAKRSKKRTPPPPPAAEPDEEDPFAPLAADTPADTTGEDQVESSDPEDDDDELVPHISEATRRARNLWHIAADWTEAFAPVIYEPIDQMLRKKATEERERLDAQIATRNRARSKTPLERPQVIFVDDVPVYGQDPRTNTRSRRDAGYFVLVVAELHWEQVPVSSTRANRPADQNGDTAPSEPETTWTTLTKLRLLRVMAKSNTPAWHLVFDELGYIPDFIVADAGTGIKAAIDAQFDPERTVFIPSLYHLSEKVKLAFKDVPGAFETGVSGKQFIPALHAHFAKLSRTSGVLRNAATWKAWWDELEQIITTAGLPRDTVRSKRKVYEPAMAKAITALGRNPLVPLTTGGLETLIARKVKPLLAMRRTSFANLERTNHLFDLVVAEQHGAFNNLSDVAALIRADGQAHGGWTVPLRTVSDPRPPRGTYSSLRDTTLLDTLAAERDIG